MGKTGRFQGTVTYFQMNSDKDDITLTDNRRDELLRFGVKLGYDTRDVPVAQVLDQALLNESARALFVDFGYGRANLDGASEWITLCAADPAPAGCPSNVVAVSDHDGFVIRLAIDRVFAHGFD